VCSSSAPFLSQVTAFSVNPISTGSHAPHLGLARLNPYLAR
jgi:hypothetical protein